jgi:hypothetical protein
MTVSAADATTLPPAVMDNKEMTSQRSLAQSPNQMSIIARPLMQISQVMLCNNVKSATNSMSMQCYKLCMTACRRLQLLLHGLCQAPRNLRGCLT